MTDDKTLLLSTGRPGGSDPDCTLLLTRAPLSVVLYQDKSKVASYSFSGDFSAGRAPDNQIVINHPSISRRHLAVKLQAGAWQLYDCASANGVFIAGNRVEHTQALPLPADVYFGRSEFHLVIGQNEVAAANSTANPDATVLLPSPGQARVEPVPKRTKLTEAEAKIRLLGDQEADDAGDYTKLVRKIIHEDRSKHKRSHRKSITALASVLILAAGLAVYQHIALNHTRQLAIDMFYDIKALEVSLSQADIKLDESAAVLENTLRTINEEKLNIAQEQIKAEQEKIIAEKLRMANERNRLAGMKAKYRQYLAEARTLKLRFPTKAAYEEDLILKVARELGESELELPEAFLQEVKKYIQLWQSSGRMQQTLDKIQRNRHLSIVVTALKTAGLPPYFLYLPLQESDYDENAIGPQTRFGIAKGAWQLLPATARQFGIQPGPLADSPEYDSQDQRFNFDLSTKAATQYLKYIYGTEAQASGLLVMSSYNYGDNRVRNMIKQMPDNPREKNFWKFIQHYELPKQTHDYVFYIFSAAVIGEDPEHFGFKFVPPLYGNGLKP